MTKYNQTIKSTPLTPVYFQQQPYLIKRDDLLHPLINGNKARKFAYYQQQDFTHIKQILSYGGAQSNAMLALSALADQKNTPFHYYVKPLPHYLKQHPQANLSQALKNGMQLHEIDDFAQIPTQNNSLLIPQGGANHYAELGLQQLAQEIKYQAQQQQWQNYSVVLPSGTGSSAFYLQQHLSQNVYTTACIGNPAYLRQQFIQLTTKRQQRQPIILEPAKKYHFAKPYAEFLQLWQQLWLQTGIVFDLLYDPLMWSVLQTHAVQLPQPIVYIHCGGLMGNESMLNRYRYKELI